MKNVLFAVVVLTMAVMAPFAVAVSQGSMHDPVALAGKVGWTKFEVTMVKEADVIEVPETVVVGTVNRAQGKAQKAQTCVVRVLEQGGSPSAPTVVYCDSDFPS